MQENNLPVTVNSPTRLSVVQGNLLMDSELVPIAKDKPPVCTWPLTDIAGRARLHRLIAGTSLVLWDETEKGPIEIEVTDVAASFSEFEPEERPGELVQAPMFYLVGPKADYHTGSTQIYQSLQQLAYIEGIPPWLPPVILRAERVITRNRRYRLAVTLIGRK